MGVAKDAKRDTSIGVTPGQDAGPAKVARRTQTPGHLPVQAGPHYHLTMLCPADRVDLPQMS